MFCKFHALLALLVQVEAQQLANRPLDNHGAEDLDCCFPYAALANDLFTPLMVGAFISSTLLIC